MVFYLGGLTWSRSTGATRVDHWWVETQTPVDGEAMVFPVVALKYLGDATQTGLYDSELQLSEDEAFTTPTTRASTIMQDGLVITENFSSLTARARYWWRVRAKSPYGDWQAWTDPISFWVLPQASTGTMGVTINLWYYPSEREFPEVTHINTGPPPQREVPEVTHMNVGPVPTRKVANLMHMNVGPAVEGHGVPEVLHFTANTDTPTPHIWWLKENYGREGDGFTIVGYGFGALQGEFDGYPIWEWNDVLETEESLSVVTWVGYPATAEAYTANRKIDKWSNTIDPVHQVVGVLVPVDVEIDTYVVKFTTEGPP